MIPIAATLALAAAWMLPLAWTTVVVSACAFAVLAGIEIARSARSSFRTATAAACCVSFVGLIGVGYAALALTNPDRFERASRLGYPFLIATGLRLPGGAGLLALCGFVSVIPALFADARREPGRERSG